MDEVLAGSLQAEGGGNLPTLFHVDVRLQRMTKTLVSTYFWFGPARTLSQTSDSTTDTKLIYNLEIKEIGSVS